jgi:hypothetical protein
MAVLTFIRAVVAISLVVVGFGQVKTNAPIKTTLCDLVKKPERFNGKMVQVRAVVVTGFEASLLRDESCSADIWLAAGFPVNLTQPGGGRKPSRPPITLKKDSDYQKMAEFLSKNYTNSDNKPCMYCPLYTVTVNAAGRFDHIDKLNTDPKDRRYVGFGHMNGYESQLVLQSVSDVVAKPIDPSVYEKK